MTRQSKKELHVYFICKTGVRTVLSVSGSALMKTETAKRAAKRLGVNECVQELQKKGSIVLVGDMNAKEGEEERDDTGQVWCESTELTRLEGA